jgi:hypothetical protein
MTPPTVATGGWKGAPEVANFTDGSLASRGESFAPVRACGDQDSGLGGQGSGKFDVVDRTGAFLNPDP